MESGYEAGGGGGVWACKWSRAQALPTKSLGMRLREEGLGGRLS